MDDRLPKWPSLVWDGLDTLIVDAVGETAAWSGYIVAHGIQASQVVTVVEPQAAQVICRLPTGCRHVDLYWIRAGAKNTLFSVELDDLLQDGSIDAALPGLQRIDISRSRSRASDLLTFHRSDATEPVAEGSVICGLFLPIPEMGGELRARVGPVRDPGVPPRLTTVRIAQREGSGFPAVELSEATAPGPGTQAVMVVHIRTAAAQMRQRLQQVDPLVKAGLEAVLEEFAQATLPPDRPDATGLGRSAGFRRGFHVLQPEPGHDALASIEIADWSAQDELVLFAPRGARLTFAGDKAQDVTGETGTRLVVKQQDGRFVATPFTRPYRPATTTALATLGSSGSGALTMHAGEGLLETHLTETAADLVAAVWARNAGAKNDETPSLLVELMPQKPEVARADVSELSPIVAALGARHGLGRSLLEDIDAMPVRSRIALLCWFTIAPDVAILATKARVELPMPDQVPAALALDLMNWFDNPDLAVVLEDLSKRITTVLTGEERRYQLARLRNMTRAAGESWIALADISEAVRLLEEYPSPEQGDTITDPLARLLERLGSDSDAATRARETALRIDLGALAQMRSELPANAIASGQSTAISHTLMRRLAHLTPVEILLLQAHLDESLDQKRFVGVVRHMVAMVDMAAGAVGFATRIDRSGDVFVGITRIAATTDPMMRELLKLTPAQAALLALKDWLDVMAPKPPASHRVATQLSRSMQIYTCYHFYMSILDECAAILAPTSFTAPGRITAADAQHRRLRSGMIETLHAYVDAAATIAGDDYPFGRAFVERLTAAADTAGNAQPEVA